MPMIIEMEDLSREIKAKVKSRKNANSMVGRNRIFTR